MAKHLLKFNTAAEYSAATIETPAVSWVVEDNEVKYDPYIPPFKGKVRITYSDGEIYEVAANASTTLTSAEVTGGTQAKTNIVTAEVGPAVTSIGGSAFNSCKGLTSVTIPDSVTSIGGSAFQHCSGLTSVVIPSGVTSINVYTFQNCYSLTSVVLPDGVTSIGNYAFASCFSLTSIVIPDSVTSIGAYALSTCTGLTNIDIPDSVTSIGNHAFYNNYESLTTVSIGSGISSIGNEVFYYCPKLTSVTVNATTPPTLGSGVFNSTNNCPIYVPSASVNAYKSASGWSDYASRIQAIPS